MRLSEVYELLCDGDTAKITQYLIRYESHEDVLVPQKSCSCSADDVITILNDCKILKWKGFQGKNPHGVRDGYMFNFYAELNGDTVIRADGSNNYPKHYREFQNSITELLN